MMRLLSFLCIVMAIAVTAIVITLSLNAQPVILEQTVIPADFGIIRELIYLVGTLLIFAFGGKVGQKFAEREINVEKKEIT